MNEIQSLEVAVDAATQRTTGTIRTTFQGFFAYVLVALAPVLETLGVDDEFGALEEPVTAFVVALALGAYWWVMTTIQQSELGRNPLVAGVIGILMGGRKAPTYLESTIVE